MDAKTDIYLKYEYEFCTKKLREKKNRLKKKRKTRISNQLFKWATT